MGYVKALVVMYINGVMGFDWVYLESVYFQMESTFESQYILGDTVGDKIRTITHYSQSILVHTVSG